MRLLAHHKPLINYGTVHGPQQEGGRGDSDKRCQIVSLDFHIILILSPRF